jgi:hypothetical protein
MSQETCFVIMPIGDQTINGKIVTSDELKARYNDLIKEAILRANLTLMYSEPMMFHNQEQLRQIFSPVLCIPILSLRTSRIPTQMYFTNLA